MRERNFIALITKRLAEASEGIFTGLASVPVPDRQGDVLPLSAFKRSLAEFRADRLVLPVLLDHDPARQIGSVLALDLTDAGLEVTAQLALGLDDGRAAFERMKAGPVGLSIGFAPAPGSITQQGDLRIIDDVDLREISVVSLPANAAARTLSLKSVPYLQDILREHGGMSMRQSKRAAAAAHRAALAEPDHDPDESDAEQGAALVLAELRRVQSIFRGN